MKSVGGLFADLTNRAWFEAAVDDAVRGRRRRPQVARFLLTREACVRALLTRLRAGRWRPGPFRALCIRDPKPRVIAYSPLEDRLVLHALARLLERVFLPSASPASFACRPGGGTHRARLALLRHLRRRHWFVHLDLRSYFPSIDLELLRELLARRIRDRPFLSVIEHVLDAGAGFYDRSDLRRFARMDRAWPPAGRGLPIGAATSQVLAAHVVLGEFDHWLQREVRVGGYVRYVDDLFLFGDDRRRLEAIREDSSDWLERERHLRLKVPHARVRSCAGALHGLGARITHGGIAPSAEALRRLSAAAAREAWGPVHGETTVAWEDSLASRLGDQMGW
ncbi:RNA-directed DNA polymerase [Engelhardtia mirabilis]|uniref:Group II intron-encoded protein LtrA n=1 Tax=Engelhardtia mirabilis TaxID=2528011 RepID=A0A518BG02_9BACT|nr:Group II intron-encoded protein LtrA [Planctomycetes bacterium Pla133]QDV00228.1 Group II intron-encoded protein LtrA [Planctomycetes bacterium Pla86]